MTTLIDLTGQRFGRLVVLSRAENGPRNAPYWNVRCDCGTERVTRGASLRTGGSKSCGCLVKDNNRRRETTHGEAQGTDHNATPEYNAWSSMKGRCHNPRDKGYPNYGGRGIEVCESWRNSYQAFLGDVGRRPGPGYSIDRIDVNGNYEPGNVRWATARQQVRNRRVKGKMLIEIQSLENEVERLRSIMSKCDQCILGLPVEE